MKKYFNIGLIFCLISLLFSCSKDDANLESSDNGTGGSMARFVLVGEFLYVIDNTNLTTFNVSNAANPIFVESQIVNFGIETLFPYENYLLIGSTTGMYIYEVKPNGVPEYLSEFAHVEACDPVVTDGTYAYVTLRTNNECLGLYNRMEILDISQPKDPVFLRHIDMEEPKGLALYENYLFVCVGNNGFLVFDKTDGSNPQQIEQISGFTANDLIAKDDRLMVVCPDGLRQFDISDISIISQISYFPVNF